MDQTLDLKGIRALLVDEDSTARRILGKAISDMGAEVSEAVNGPRAIVELKQARDRRRPFELIFVAAEMAGMDGFEMAGHAKSHPEELRRIVLILGSGRPTHDMLRGRGLDLGGYLVRPFNRQDLIELVSSVVGIRPTAPGAAPAAPAAPASRALRVLLAEDSKDIREIIKFYLAGAEFQLDTVENGGVAVDLFRLSEYDLILMDLQMPGFDGYWANREIRAWEKKNNLKRTPVIAITSYPEVEDAQKSFRAGFDGYLTKPVDKQTLLAAIRKLTGGSTHPRPA